MATQRKSQSQQARKTTDASDPLFSELAAQTFGVLGWKKVDHRGGDIWSVQDNVLSADARELRLTVVNDSARRSDARGLQLGRDILFDGAALGHYLSSAAAEEPSGHITLRKQGRKAQQ